MYSLIALPVHARKKMIPKRAKRATTNPGQRMKSSQRGESRSAWYNFVWSILTFFQNNFPNNARTKLYQAILDLPRWILLCQDPRSFWGAMVCFGIILFSFFKEVELVCVCSIIECLRAWAIRSHVVQNNVFLNFFLNSEAWISYTHVMRVR